eukprot:TRINITY_DN352_c0_g2_i1.p1 TRINITY_DN352_c0_g2~~TRINITY_DN352_c0_g2_i1.p1  ORF type:complete len:120 (+),score=22.22 TRINITY_DN352_c0_g2_i1:40-399(+)
MSLQLPLHIKKENQFDRGDFLFDEPSELLSSNHLQQTKKLPPKSAPPQSSPTVTNITDVDQHRRDKKDQLAREIIKKQEIALKEKRAIDEEIRILHDEKQAHSSELQYKLDTWEFKSGS